MLHRIPNPINHPCHQFAYTTTPSKQPSTTSLSLSSPTPTTTTSNSNQKPTTTTTTPYSIAHFGAGCFWSPADALSRLPGIQSVTVGYAGDDDAATQRTPNYEYICSGCTNLVETVRVAYDPRTITYRELLDSFDLVKKVDVRGKRQYAGVIFVDGDDAATADVAASWLEEKTRRDPADAAAITIEPLSQTFWVAEEYHQNFWGKWRPRIAWGVALLVLQSHGVVPYGR